MVKSFGIEDMVGLAGGAENEEMAAFRPSVAGPQLAGKKKQLPNEEPDVSTMTAAETAAMLMERNEATKGTGNQSSRYRTNRVLAHHALAKELSEELQIRQRDQLQPTKRENEQSDPESEDEFATRRGSTARRQRAAPKIISLSSKDEPAPNAPSQHRRKRRNSDSSSSSSDESSKRRRRPSGRGRRDSDDDTSSSSDEEDRRRARLRASRARQEPQIIQTVNQTPVEKEEIIISKETIISNAPIDRKKLRDSPASEEEVAQQRSRAKKTAIGTEGESSSEDSSSSGDSSSSDDSSSEEEGAIAKPVFVPKHKRNLLQTEEKKWEEEELRTEREKKRAESRKMESRAMLARTVAAVQTSNMDDDVDEEGGGASNAPPNDDDAIDVEKERDAWEVRELRRLLDSMYEMKQREKEKVELERRRQMTDAEVLQHDTETGRYHAPGSNREGGNASGKLNQRFFHRGAYYMAEDEWDEDDIRRKAAEYAKAATGEDKIDRSALPEVMQVKGFGMARQNTRYKGLAKEDTSDRKQEFLPLIHKKK
jgi:microfibrillar-associated protein 1